jgi:hypothetical protein
MFTSVPVGDVDAGDGGSDAEGDAVVSCVRTTLQRGKEHAHSG